MRGNEFIRRIQNCAHTHGLNCEWRADRGKGSHGLLIFGNLRTLVRNPKHELKSGTYHAMLKQLGLSERDIR
jgi:mRNA interferase HicA